MKKSLVRSDIVEVEIQRIPGPCCLVTKFSPAAVALCPEPFMFLLTTVSVSFMFDLRQDKGASEEHYAAISYLFLRAGKIKCSVKSNPVSAVDG